MARSASFDPVDKFRFTVELSALEGSDISRAGFSSCSLPSESSGEISYREGNFRDTMEKSPGLTSYSDITLSRGVTSDQDFYKWCETHKKHSATVRPSGDSQFTAKDERPSDDAKNSIRREVTITVLDREGKAVKTWKCYNCHVSEFTPGDSLDSTSEEKLMTSLTLRIEGYEEILPTA